MVVVIDGEIGSTCWSIHKQGCKDIERTIQEAGMGPQKRLDSFDSAANAVSGILDEMAELGFTEEDIKIFNCAR
jgi:hypothetical protein